MDYKLVLLAKGKPGREIQGKRKWAVVRVSKEAKAKSTEMKIRSSRFGEKHNTLSRNYSRKNAIKIKIKIPEIQGRELKNKLFLNIGSFH